MGADIVMDVAMYVFAILFAFLTFTFGTAIISSFKKKKFEDFEPKVSVVIPAYNEEKSIISCLDAIYSLDYPKNKIEVIAVDDGSTDKTMDFLKEYQKIHPDLIILNGNHEGKVAGLNKGIKKARHDLIFAVDADTVIGKDVLSKLARPFADSKIGATNGSCVVKNPNSVLGVFQSLEFHCNSLMRKSFSNLFNNGIWFFGAFACYRKKALEKIGYINRNTLVEDMDTAMSLYKAGYRTINVPDALGYTLVHSNFKKFFNQRVRWWLGGLRTLGKNKKMFSVKSNPSILFLFINQYWWTLFALISFPLIAYQIYYWLPYNSQNFVSLFMYLFRWFSLAGPIYVLYKIPEWGISFYNIFGVLSGIMSVSFIIWAVYLFKDKLSLKNIAGIFFYFPYTIILNTIVVASVVMNIFLKKECFVS